MPAVAGSPSHPSTLGVPGICHAPVAATAARAIPCVAAAVATAGIIGQREALLVVLHANKSPAAGRAGACCWLSPPASARFLAPLPRGETPCPCVSRFPLLRVVDCGRAIVRKSCEFEWLRGTEGLYVGAGNRGWETFSGCGREGPGRFRTCVRVSVVIVPISHMRRH